MLGGTLAAGGANAINMVVDRDIDAPDGPHQGTGRWSPARCHPARRSTFAIGLEVLAFALLWGTVNLLSAVLAVAACLFYVFVYTLWLKRTSTRNIVIGGAAGAVPVLIGWSSVTGTLGLGAGRAVRDHLLLDPAPLLGPGDPVQGRLLGRRRADAARSS